MLCGSHEAWERYTALFKCECIELLKGESALFLGFAHEQLTLPLGKEASALERSRTVWVALVATL
ncbi:MAG: hypothetical protein DSM106950_19065 [Stigonema ocellatum SAG 48.90 = DSM 106950]|nr:hypothetical protein [Stigonema ocellatum SAG 48.90 = DSM 106950]